MAATDQLVCHRVKECCVHLHSCVQKWKELNNKGFDVASKLINVSLQKKYTHQHNKYGILKDIDCLQHSLESKMITERERLLKELGETYKEMVKVVDRMGSLSSNLKSAAELALTKSQEPSEPLFHTLPPAEFGVYSEEIYSTYSHELSLRESIVGDIMKQKDRDTLTVYLSCWLHEPYIGTETTDHLEAMLIECDLRT